MSTHKKDHLFLSFISDWLGEENFSFELSEPRFIETKSVKDEDVMIHLYSSSYGNTGSVLSL